VEIWPVLDQCVSQISPQAWEAVRKVLPLSFGQLLDSRLRETDLVSDGLLDSSRMRELLDLWRQSVQHNVTDWNVILAVGAVAFRP
jgi:hypothetical protein